MLRTYAHAMREDERDLSFADFGAGPDGPSPSGTAATSRTTSRIHWRAGRDSNPRPSGSKLKPGRVRRRQLLPTCLRRQKPGSRGLAARTPKLAEREGFEPPVGLRLHLISSQAHSTRLWHLSARGRQASNRPRRRGLVTPLTRRQRPDVAEWTQRSGRMGRRAEGPMRWEHTRKQLISVLALAPFTVGAAALAGDFRHRPGPAPSAGSVSWLLRWNQIAIDASGADHAGAKEQLGPGRASRAMAIVHIAIFDALNAIGRRLRELHAPRARGLRPVAEGGDRAGRRTTRWSRCFPSQTTSFDAALAADLAQVRDRRAKTEGVRARTPRRRGHPRAPRERRLAARRSRCWAPTTCRATRRASGGRIRSASSPSRSARTGAR